ncbi:MAG: hypothetical protein NC434_04335 [Ruminococcus sp.]|nr:hypothetical protein [Ruminococcus sp.]
MENMMVQIDLQAVAALPEQAQARLKGFKKNTYEASFEAFMEDNRTLWDSFHALFMQEEDITQTAQEVAGTLADAVAEIVSGQKGRVNRESRQLDLNLYMVSYVFPALLSCQEYPKKDNNATKTADIICAKWKETFPGYTISYADFASIQGGFKQKLCYVTTAVCESLHKRPDCKEIQVMKKYRDEYLLKQPEGPQIIEEYYDIAPTIVKRIDKSVEAEEKYRYLWEHYLRFCVSMIEAGQYEECGETYQKMVEELKEEYLVTNRKK